MHEQVANKLSVQFADIGEQEVKNIPTPVHAYMVAMRREDGTVAMPQVKKPAAAKAVSTPNWMWPLVVAVVCLVAIGVAGFLYFTRIEMLAGSRETPTASKTVVPSPSPTLATPEPSPPSLAPAPSTESFAAEAVPFVPDRAHNLLAKNYVPGAGL